MATNGNGIRGRRAERKLSAHQAKSSAWITPKRRLGLYLRDRFQCLYCAKDLHRAPAADVTLDHLLSQSEIAALDEETRTAFGSPHANHNLVTACRSCNSARKDKPWTTFATLDAQARILAARQIGPNLELAKAIINGEAPDPRTESRAS